MDGRDGGLRRHGMEQEERFVSAVMPCFQTIPPTPGTNFISSTAKVCSELVSAEMRMVAYPTVTSPPCSVKASPGAHEANKAPVATTDLGIDESRRSRSSVVFDTAEDNSFRDVENLSSNGRSKSRSLNIESRCPIPDRRCTPCFWATQCSGTRHSQRLSASGETAVRMARSKLSHMPSCTDASGWPAKLFVQPIASTHLAANPIPSHPPLR